MKNININELHNNDINCISGGTCTCDFSAPKGEICCGEFIKEEAISNSDINDSHSTCVCLNGSESRDPKTGLKFLCCR